MLLSTPSSEPDDEERPTIPPRELKRQHAGGMCLVAGVSLFAIVWIVAGWSHAAAGSPVGAALEIATLMLTAGGAIGLITGAIERLDRPKRAAMRRFEARQVAIIDAVRAIDG
jgi:hypothetical protein